jgi:hypothetical protein
MHPQGCCRAYDHSQGVPTYRYNPELNFPKPYFKSNRFKRILFKTKDVLGFKIFIQIPYLVLIKGFQNPKLCQNKLLFEVKMASKEKGILKSFVPFKTLWPLPNVLKISVPFQNAL